MKWNVVKKHFEDDGALVDIYYEGMSAERWVALFNWLRKNENVTSVNCYNPTNDQNLEYLPENIGEMVNLEGFYCVVSLRITGILVCLRFYIESELECDVSPKEIDSEAKLHALLGFLSEVQKVVRASRYFMCPESWKKGTFNINGEFVR